MERVEVDEGFVFYWAVPGSESKFSFTHKDIFICDLAEWPIFDNLLIWILESRKQKNQKNIRPFCLVLGTLEELTPYVVQRVTACGACSYVKPSGYNEAIDFRAKILLVRDDFLPEVIKLLKNLKSRRYVMSINLVQRFVVEVDSLSLLEKFLMVAVDTIFESKDQIIVNLPGRKNMEKLPSPVNDPQKNFPIFLIGGWDTKEKIADSRYITGGDRFNKKTPYDIKQYLNYVKNNISTYGSEWRREFIKTIGDGYDDSFNHYDGRVVTGYEIRSCGIFPEVLAVSLTHIYYGK